MKFLFQMLPASPSRVKEKEKSRVFLTRWTLTTVPIIDSNRPYLHDVLAWFLVGQMLHWVLVAEAFVQDCLAGRMSMLPC